MRETEVRYFMQGIKKSENYYSALKWLFDLPDLKRVVLTSAYTDARGVNLILDSLIEHKNIVSIYTGINNGVTSFEAIKLLTDNDITVYGIDTANPSTIFHQKAYLACSEYVVRAVMPSANLTWRGLTTNFEGGVTLELHAGAGLKLKTEFFSALYELRKRFPDNFVKFRTQNDLVANKPLLANSKQRNRRITSDTLKTAPTRTSMKPEVMKIPPGNKSNSLELAVDQKESSSCVYPYGELIWHARATKRHLNISTEITHGTGSFNLGLGLKGSVIERQQKDFQTYYHFDLFSELDWVKTDSGVEFATSLFDFYIDGVYLGDYLLTISYTQAKATVKQRNTTTSIKWGDNLSRIVNNPSYIGGELSLWRRDKDAETPYVIVLMSPASS